MKKNRKCRKSQRLTAEICRKSQRNKSCICRKSQYILINGIRYFLHHWWFSSPNSSYKLLDCRWFCVSLCPKEINLLINNLNCMYQTGKNRSHERYYTNSRIRVWFNSATGCHSYWPNTSNGGNSLYRRVILSHNQTLNNLYLLDICNLWFNILQKNSCGYLSMQKCNKKLCSISITIFIKDNEWLLQ